MKNFGACSQQPVSVCWRRVAILIGNDISCKIAFAEDSRGVCWGHCFPTADLDLGFEILILPMWIFPSPLKFETFGWQITVILFYLFTRTFLLG